MTDLKIVIEKVTEERKAIEQKKQKLESFIMSKNFQKLDTETRVQLLTQQHHINGYSNALMCRVAHMREMLEEKGTGEH